MHTLSTFSEHNHNLDGSVSSCSFHYCGDEVCQAMFFPAILFGPHAGQIIMAAVICPREQNIWSEPNMAVIFCPTWTKI